MFLKIKDEIINLDRVENIRLMTDRVLFVLNGENAVNFHSGRSSTYGDAYNISLSGKELSFLKDYLRGYLDSRLDNLTNVL